MNFKLTDLFWLVVLLLIGLTCFLLKANDQHTATFVSYVDTVERYDLNKDGKFNNADVYWLIVRLHEANQMKAELTRKQPKVKSKPVKVYVDVNDPNMLEVMFRHLAASDVNNYEIIE